MRERPILFNSEMVRAIFDGRKTQTRRVVKPQLPDEPLSVGAKKWGIIGGNFYYCGVKCPYGIPGDRLWVRETWVELDIPDGNEIKKEFFYKATDWKGWLEYEVETIKWKPSIHMPRWASRLTLEITNVRVERLQEITEEDAEKEGVRPFQYQGEPPYPRLEYRGEFIKLWDSINGKKYPWASNPWVWVIEFRVLPQREDV